MTKRESVINILVSERIIQTNFRKYLKDFLASNNLDLDFDSVFVLATLENLDNLTQKDISVLFGYDPATTGRIVDRLVKAKLITKVKDKTDARKNTLTITDSGLKLIGLTENVVVEWFRNEINPITKNLSKTKSISERICEIAKIMRIEKGGF